MAFAAVLPLIESLGAAGAAEGAAAGAAGAGEVAGGSRLMGMARQGAGLFGGGNRGNKGGPRKENFEAGSGRSDLFSSTNDYRPY